MIKNIITDPSTGTQVKVTEFGELVQGAVAYDESSSVKMEVNDTVYNIVAPNTGEYLVITGILLYANRNVSGTTEATVDVYCSSTGPSAANTGDSLLLTEMTKQTYRDVTSLSLLCEPGSWINATTSDDDVYITIMYRRIAKL
jgi:hypothetical protein